MSSTHRLLAGVGLTALALSGCSGSHFLAGTPSGMTAGPASRAGTPSGTERVLYNFTGGNDGGNAATGLTLDTSGNLFGTTVIGGTYNCGTTFELAHRAGSRWHESVLYSFTCYGDGKNPHGGVTLERGNLDGTTVAGGSGGSCSGDGCGVVFQLQPGGERVLHSFTGGNDGFGPGGGVTSDSLGSLFGTTPDGGTYSQGVVYEVSRSGRQWHERVIHAFTGGKDGGVGSLGLLLFESASLYGVTELAGAHAAGTVFKLSPSGHAWNLTTLYAFKGTPDAGYPYGGLIADAAGNLFGTTYYGGASGLGSVFELVHGAHGYRERVLYSFKGGADGSSSTSTLLLVGSDLYGTTSAGGGSCDCGTIFKVSVHSGVETVLHAFGAGSDGAYPYYGLTKDAAGNLYGTTVAGGANGQGTVFEYTP